MILSLQYDGGRNEMDKLIEKQAGTIIGMVHCLPLPGSPGFDGDYNKILNQAVEDALTLEKAGVDAVIIENMGDTPFTALLKTQVTALTAAAMAVRDKISIPFGIDAAFNDCEVSIAIAAITGASFVRIPVFVDTVLFSDGIIYPCANKCMSTRKNLHAEHVKILADVQVKHSTMLSSNISIEQSAKDAVSNGADGILVTGSAIGVETPIEMIKRVQKVVNVPVLAASGVNAHNIKEQLQIADGCIIGSSLKKGGVISNPIDYDLVCEVVSAYRK